MAKLEILENKKLVLKNVLKKELNGVQFEVLDEEINKFGLLLDKLSAQTFGPLVMKNGGVNISEDGEMTMDYDLFVQAHDYKQYKGSFDVVDCMEVPNCVYVRFEGSPDDLQYAHSKLDLHFYENEIESTEEIYSIIVEETENHTVVDIFRPVKVL